MLCTIIAQNASWGFMAIWKNRGPKGQPEAVRGSTLSADPTAVPVPVALMALIE